MNRRRTALLAAVVAGASLLTPQALADEAGDRPAVGDVIDVQTAQERYWACVALDHVHVGTCLENPLPDVSGYPTVPDTLRRVLGSVPPR